MSRPSSYTPELAAAICERLAAGESLRAICRGEGMPPAATVIGWVTDNREDFAEQYARAKDVGLDLLADEILEISDQDPGVVPGTGATDAGAVAHQRLRVDSRKWYASKLAPKRYGDKLELGGNVKATLQVVTGVPDGDDCADLV